MIEKDFKLDFPMLNNSSYIFFDNSATSLKPQCVVDSISEYYLKSCANAERGDYEYSYKIDKKIDEVRESVKQFINSKTKNEIVFTSGSTQGLGMIVDGYIRKFIKENDVIITTKAEHASSILPLMRLAEDKKVKIEFIDIDDNGNFNLEQYMDLIEHKSVKFVVLAQISNVLGYEMPIKKISEIAHTKDVKVIVDGAQSVPHMKVDVQELNCDFLTFSAHKMCGPTGLGILYGKKNLLEEMDPIFIGGGSNINYFEDGTYFLKNAPHKFEVGTLPLAQIYGFQETLNYLNEIGMESIHEKEVYLKNYLISRLKELENVQLYNPNTQSGIVLFNIKGIFGGDVAKFFNKNKIAVRTGQHCSRLLIDYFQTNCTIRVSLYFYNTKDEIDKFIEICKQATKENIYNLIFE